MIQQEEITTVKVYATHISITDFIKQTLLDR
jgi:hypothetical protein